MATPPKIGDHEFCFLHGQPLVPVELLEIVARSGVNGVGIWRDGTRPEPCELTSQVDCASLELGRATFLEYTALVKAAPVELVWEELNLTVTEGLLWKVLAVRPLELRGLAGGSGPFLNPPSSHWLVCQWTLLAIPQAAETEP